MDNEKININNIRNLINLSTPSDVKKPKKKPKEKIKNDKKHLINDKYIECYSN